MRRSPASSTPTLDDAIVATLLAAVMDGLQLQFLLDPEAVDMVEPIENAAEAARRRPVGSPPWRMRFSITVT